MTSISFLIVFTSAFKNEQKVKVNEKLVHHKKAMRKLLKRENYGEASESFSSSTHIFLFFFIHVCCFVCITLYIMFYLPIYVYVGLQYQFFTNTINVQSFQILLLSKAVENQLKAFCSIDVNRLSDSDLIFFKDRIISVFEIICDTSDCFNLPILFVNLWNFFSVLANLHWIGAFFLGAPNDGLIGD